ncbi:hypothetical protein BKK79_22440 [Cupriavidus sp. USMAA2-4]|uniref:Uncharacterized protein n=1 Tax=Cupriavidus malaysiensis TaxID=367825 RepID=A0ABM6FE84_9BURK|nr:hypothetical protein BKK79_22440 [Cupriavidus sp. USMAA2-4]AOZ10164.1 hypothetical protein BKK80_31555 [Cupriavidus malaysiensis]
MRSASRPPWTQAAATALISTSRFGRASDATPRIVQAGNSRVMQRALISRNAPSCSSIRTW